ncbi:MAG TPA: type II toxin-antitoxin system prevent-host-death family antitoxin, partial [Candidatus Nanopelagicales bacterium]
LRQHASRYIDLVKAGETVEVTERGRPVARLVPVKDERSVLQRLIDEGHATPPTNPRPWNEIEPLPALTEGPTLSEILMRMREDER